MRYTLVRPCAHCPFRTDVPGYLRRARAVEIASSLAEGAEFPCHESTVEDPDSDGTENMAVGTSQFCAGALIVMEHMQQPNQIVRIAERIGAYDASRLDMSAPVQHSLIAFVDHHGDPDQDSDDCCCIVDAGCEAPAGYLINGVVIPADNPGELHDCPSCGEPVCDSCSNDDGACRNCEEDR